VKLHKDVTAHLKVVIEKEAVAEVGGLVRDFKLSEYPLRVLLQT